MNRFIKYLKYSSIFIIIELLISFIVSLLNILGLDSGITTIILFILNILLFATLNYINSKKSVKNGFIEGLILGSIFIILMILIKLIFLKSSYSITNLIYYSILIMVSMFSGMLGINKKNDSN